MSEGKRRRLRTSNDSASVKPHWIRVKSPGRGAFGEVEALIKENSLHTVCQEAACPNIGECWSKRHATIMILGDICTRSCRFCNIKMGKPKPVDVNEPANAAKTAKALGLKHMVITSVDRDDLDDGGALQFASCIKEIRAASPSTTIEVLTPDFRGKEGALEIVVDANPDVFNHNLETCPRLYRDIRPKARYFHSLNILWRAKQINPKMFTKSGIMVGIGETKDEVIQIMDDMRSAGVDFMTIGQYLQPTPFHAPIDRFVTPDEFNEYKDIGLQKGFLMISSTPLTRSSYHADDDFEELRKNRDNA